MNFDPTAEQLYELGNFLPTKSGDSAFNQKGIPLTLNFGSQDTPSSAKVREATAMFMERYPDIEADGEMHADAALDEKVRLDLLLQLSLTGKANLLIVQIWTRPTSREILLKVLGNGVTVGPLLLGLDKEAHVATASNSPRGIFNMAAVALANVNRSDD